MLPHKSSPSSILVGKTPHEACTCKKISHKHLKLFGFDAYVHLPKENKLEIKAEKCIFIGYKDCLNGNMIWNPKNRKVFYSRDERQNIFSNRKCHQEKIHRKWSSSCRMNNLTM